MIIWCLFYITSSSTNQSYGYLESRLVDGSHNSSSFSSQLLLPIWETSSRTFTVGETEKLRQQRERDSFWSTYGNVCMVRKVAILFRNISVWEKKGEKISDKEMMSNI